MTGLTTTRLTFLFDLFSHPNGGLFNYNFEMPEKVQASAYSDDSLLPGIVSQSNPARANELGWPSAKVRFHLSVQSVIGLTLLMPFCWLLLVLMKYFRGYRFENLTEIRANFRRLVRHPNLQNEPLMICANHLTFIDSALMIWAFAPLSWYLFNHRYFTWNLPAGDFFKKKFHFRLIAYLTKCIFIHRDGSRDHKNDVLARCRYLLEKGHIVSLFPEGKRSRTGRFDPEKITYGVGKILSGLEKRRVLCVYLRGNKQETYSNYPPRGSRFYLKMELISPRTEKTGREAYRDIGQQIAQTIHRLEGEYFANAS